MKEQFRTRPDSYVLLTVARDVNRMLNLTGVPGIDARKLTRILAHLYTG
jgi:hypothetical protein